MKSTVKAQDRGSHRVWLVKSEPDSYSIDDLQRDACARWEGVRNYQARNFMMNEMKVGDELLFYHSSANPSAAVGLARVSKPATADASALDPRSPYHDPKAAADKPIWYCVEVAFTRKFARPVTLEEIRAEPSLAAMPLLQRGQRLSIQPMNRAELDRIVAMSEAAAP